MKLLSNECTTHYDLFLVYVHVCIFIYDVILLYKQGMRLFSNSSYTHFLVLAHPLVL
jgi:hypothetical protein